MLSLRQRTQPCLDPGMVPWHPGVQPFSSLATVPVGAQVSKGPCVTVKVLVKGALALAYITESPPHC